MSTHSICFNREIRKISVLLAEKKHLIWSCAITAKPLTLLGRLSIKYVKHACISIYHIYTKYWD